MLKTIGAIFNVLLLLIMMGITLYYYFHDQYPQAIFFAVLYFGNMINDHLRDIKKHFAIKSF